jgi:hypothetical protein
MFATSTFIWMTKGRPSRLAPFPVAESSYSGCGTMLHGLSDGFAIYKNTTFSKLEPRASLGDAAGAGSFAYVEEFDRNVNSMRHVAGKMAGVP